MIILGIETSCDDTGVALIKCASDNCRILANVVSSQVKIHAPYGGIVPNLAARAHLTNLKPCFHTALEQAKNQEIDLIAVTRGPGLIPSLLVGVNFAKALAYAWQKPLVGINHLEAHIYANWLDKHSYSKEHQQNQFFPFPILCLLVSGGHTQLILMRNHNSYQLLGETRDDAAGEAFDKVAKLLDLGYPGGPIIAEKAKQGDPNAINLPRPMLQTNDFDFSFSGLKTAVLYEIKKHKPNIHNMAASFQQAVIDVLITKTIRAAQQYKAKTIMLSGGVAANQELRQQITKAVKKALPQTKLSIPAPKFCTDNAAMIALAAYYKKRPSSLKSWSKIKAEANLRL